MRSVTAVATLIGFVGTVSFGASDQYGFTSNAIAYILSAMLLVALAWAASTYRYAPVMLACAGVALVPWTDGWAGANGSASPGAGLMTLGVLLTSFISANSKAELRAAWEQCAPAAAAASGWLAALALALTLAAESLNIRDSPGPWVVWLGAGGFLILATVAARRARERVSQGAVPSAYMSGRDFTSVLVLKFLGGGSYVGFAMMLVVSSLTFVWLQEVGSAYPRSATETFPSEGHGAPPSPKR